MAHIISIKALIFNNIQHHSEGWAQEFNTLNSTMLNNVNENATHLSEAYGLTRFMHVCLVLRSLISYKGSSGDIIAMGCSSSVGVVIVT